MGFFSDLIDIGSFEKFADVAASVASIASAGAAVYSTIQQVDIAQEQAGIQRRELEKSQRLATLEAKRTARIARANIIAQGAAGGISSSIISGRLAGIGTDLTSGIADLEEATAFNINQLGLEVADVERAAIGGITENVFTAGIETVGLLGSLLPEEEATTTAQG